MARRLKKLPSLEKNILKYRAFEMLLVVFEIEELRRFVVDSIRGTDAILKNEHRLPPQAKPRDLMERVWCVVKNHGILDDEECEDVQRMFAYRNTIAHRIHEMTADISEFARRGGAKLPFDGYDYAALEKIRRYKHKIYEGFRQRFILSTSLNRLYFEPAERVFEDELTSLRKRIDKQWNERTRAVREQGDK